MPLEESCDSTQSEASAQSPKSPGRIRLLGMLLVGLGLTWILGYWIRQAEIVVLACQVTEAVPAIPGLAAFLLLLVLNPLLRRVPFVRKLSNGELVIVYLLVTIATTMFGCGIIRFLISCISVPHYFSTPAAPLEQLARTIPGWLSPTDPLIHQWLYEASPFGTVPWGAWAVPIAAWTGFFMVFGGTLLCLMLLFSEGWIHHERLVFPLVRLPLEILKPSTTTSFFRNPATWIGIGTAAVLNLINIVRAVFFGGNMGALQITIGRQVTAQPWTAVFPMTARLRPGLIGLGYLVSTELAFSIWFFCLFHKLQALLMAVAGYRLSGMPFPQEQGIGVYLVLGLILLWKGRKAFGQAARGWLAEGGASHNGKPSQRWLLLGVIAGVIALMMFMTGAGMQPWLAGLYLGILLIVAITYGRLRAETGIPLVWAFPYGQQHNVIWNFLGQERIIGSGAALASPTIFAMMQFLSRGYFPTVSGYEIEGINLGQQTGVNWRQVAWAVMLGIGFGAVAGFIFHLQPYYLKGGLGLRGGIWGWPTAQQEYLRVLHGAEVAVPPDMPRIVATCFGGLLGAALAAARSQWLSFPLYPIGYAVASAYDSLVWAPFLVVWLLKTLILRYGGSKLYLKALPGFLGFALGHFVTAGLIWGLLSAALGGPFLRWGVWFG